MADLTAEFDTRARVYLESQADSMIVVALPGTQYRLHLKTDGPVKPTPQGRLSGVIRCPVWKVDEVSAGGAFVEPIEGRPRRVQGRIVGMDVQANRIVVEVCQTPIVADVPPRWNVASLPIGSRVGLDVRDGSTFEQLP